LKTHLNGGDIAFETKSRYSLYTPNAETKDKQMEQKEEISG
jgi:hypothetical protein